MVNLTPSTLAPYLVRVRNVKKREKAKGIWVKGETPKKTSNLKCVSN